LAEQRSLAPVLRFSEIHESGSLPANARFYRDLIPLSQPAPGQQYAFEVDLDQCSGCKACVTACHSLNGLDEDETWRSVGLLHDLAAEQPFQQSVTTACHHCIDPGCLTGCPVNAYDKDPVTGIVRHLDDQCIGCQYCVLKCPYDVPKYNPSKGIVRKCDMCSGRLAAGEAPACVQGCPNEAIRITIVNTQKVTDDYRLRTPAESFLPTSPDPRITLPTTRYISSRPLSAQLTQGGADQLEPAASHFPLVLMLTLTQLSVGGFMWLSALSSITTSNQGDLLATLSLVFGFAGLLVSIFHLGRPHLAWRAVLNLRTSWMSREIALFGLFATAAVLHAMSRAEALVFGAASFPNFRLISCWFTLAAGLLAVFCSVMIYDDTHRVFWNSKRTSIRFFGTTLLLGASLIMLLVPSASDFNFVALVALLASACKMSWELSLLRTKGDASLIRSAALMKGPLRRFTIARFIFGGLGGLLCPLLLLTAGPSDAFSIIAGGGFLFCFAGELLERFLFFTAVAPERMPRGVTP
jgi:Fe-S-cluster-containing dehydrogenase component/DMSO reductase anchor subunit